ncbi:hypothetical protein COCNU_scaffold007706G000010 [Cocos nucifera]|nr:hypothetical protein [Cocos nucifera]
MKRVHCQDAEALKAKEDLQVEIDHLKAEKAIEAERITQEKAVEVRSLQDALQKEEFVSAELKVALALEEEKRKEVEIKVVNL